MKKLSARWMPRLLIMGHNKRDVWRFQNNVWKCFDVIQMNFCVDSLLWTKHGFTPETKEQSKQWISSNEPAPKKAKTVKSVGKVKATVFWDTRSIIHIDYLTSKQTINGDYYALLDRLNNILKKKRPHLAKKKVLIKTMHKFTCPAPMGKFNSVTNCFPFQHIRQI